MFARPIVKSVGYVDGGGAQPAYKIETHFLDGVFDRPLPAASEGGGLRVIFQIPKFLRVPESRAVGEHFGLLFGSGTRNPGELRVTKVYISGFLLLFPFMEFSLPRPTPSRVT